MSEPIAETPTSSAGVAAASDDAMATARSGGEIRLSFKLFFVTLKWGHERRSPSRIEEERRSYPVLTATHAPVLIALWAGIFLLAFYALRMALETLVYLFSA